MIDLGDIIPDFDFIFLAGNDESVLSVGKSRFKLDGSESHVNSYEKGSFLTSEITPFWAEKDWKFGFISYDYKNALENLNSNHPDFLGFQDSNFFKPELVLKRISGENIVLKNNSGFSKETIDLIFSSLQNVKSAETEEIIRISSRLSREAYIERVLKVKAAIRAGDIYELNFCLEFYAENLHINPALIFSRLKAISPAPFSAFCRFGHKYLISSSPERFLKKTGDQLVSQPIKGTRQRSNDPVEDLRLRNELASNEKEQAENVMIVDLVRNDFSRIAKKGSVKVDELFGIYSFPQVHQMISTVSCTVNPDIPFFEIIKATFPMGSMTGAPKIRAMQLIEELEVSRRGIYSGALGYITPEGDFDFSVVIRSIMYDAEKKYLSFMVGSAITDQSDPEAEYEECLLKAKGMMEALNATLEPD